MDMYTSREQIAKQAYLSLLKTKGVDDTTVQDRETILDELIILLEDQVLDGSGYRTVIEAFVEQKPADDWPMVLSTAREFYHFWMEDIEKIVALNKNQAFEQDEKPWQPVPISMRELNGLVKVEKYDSAEIWPLKAYKQALKKYGAEKRLIDARAKFAKMMILRLRESPVKNHQTYRTVVDGTLPLFRLKKTRQLYLEVVREFYHFWSGNPEAENFIFES